MLLVYLPRPKFYTYMSSFSKALNYRDQYDSTCKSVANGVFASVLIIEIFQTCLTANKRNGGVESTVCSDGWSIVIH